MTRYFIGIGSNDQADRNCRLMMESLQNTFENVQFSQLTRTKAVGIEAPDYLNAVACFESDMTTDALNRWCKQLENQLGRDRQQTLCCADLDILLAIEGDDPLEPEDVERVEDCYFRPLMSELLSFA